MVGALVEDVLGVVGDSGACISASMRSISSNGVSFAAAAARRERARVGILPEKGLVCTLCNVKSTIKN